MGASTSTKFYCFLHFLEPYGSSPKIMSPLGFGHRQRYLDDDSDVEYYEDEYYYGTPRSRTKPVPIWLCVLLVVSYIFGGAFLFQVSTTF